MLSGVTVQGINHAAKHAGFGLQLERRKDLRFMNHLVSQEVGMFVGVGEIFVDFESDDVASHYFAFDAGRKVSPVLKLTQLLTCFLTNMFSKVLVDRAGELNLLDKEDISKEGINRIFFRRYAPSGQRNLDWKVVKTMYQVVRVD